MLCTWPLMKFPNQKQNLRFYIRDCTSVNKISLCWKTPFINVFTGIMAPPGTPKPPAKTCATMACPTFPPTKCFPSNLSARGFCPPESHEDMGGYQDWGKSQARNAPALIPPAVRQLQSRSCEAALSPPWANPHTFGFPTTDEQAMARRRLDRVLPYLPLRACPRTLWEAPLLTNFVWAYKATISLLFPKHVEFVTALKA